MVPWAFLEAFVWGGRPFPFLFLNSGKPKHIFDQLCVKEIEQAGAELSYSPL